MRLEKNERIDFNIKRDKNTGTLTISTDDGLELKVAVKKPNAKVDDGLKDLARQLLKCWCVFGLTPDLVKVLYSYEIDLAYECDIKNEDKIEDLIDELAYSLGIINSITYSNGQDIPSIVIRTTHLKEDNKLVERLVEINEYFDINENDNGKAYAICIVGKDCFNKFFDAIHEAYLDHLVTTDNLKK